MPELPEVQTIVNQLGSRIVGQKIVDVEIRMAKIFLGDKKKVLGAKIKSVERRAKIILIHLDNDHSIAVHLKMTGQLVYGERDQKKKEGLEGKDGTYLGETISFHQGIAYAGFELPGKTTRVIFDLDRGAKLFFNDMRQFGWVRVITNDELRIIDEKHGPEPFGKDFTLEYFAEILSNWGRSVKLLLMDQEKIAGIGNIYANEALWYSKIDPNETGRKLAGQTDRVKKLFDDIKKVLEMGIKYQGASDNSYVNALGLKGGMQEHFMVYQQQGKSCQRCGTKIEVSRIGGRGTFFCPKCQKD